jgi:hypothetical protein
LLFVGLGIKTLLINHRNSPFYAIGLSFQAILAVVFLAMRLYFKILKRLRERDLVGKVSVREVLFALSKMRLIVETSGREYLCALPKKTEQILEVFSDCIPMA